MRRIYLSRNNFRGVVNRSISPTFVKINTILYYLASPQAMDGEALPTYLFMPPKKLIDIMVKDVCAVPERIAGALPLDQSLAFSVGKFLEVAIML